jgi:hypothetical protein
MNRSKHRIATQGIVALVLFALCVSAFGHEHVLVGHNAAGQLAAHFDQTEPVRLGVSSLPGVKGWAGGGPGIESIGKDDQEEDFFALPSSAQIEMVLVAADPNLNLFAAGEEGFVPIGGTWVVVSPFFHMHPFWNLSEGTYGSVYQAQMQFFDKSGEFTASEVVTIDLVPACPGDVDLSTAVDVDDLLAVISSWGACPNACEDPCHADLDETCIVDVDDLLTVIGAWGDCVR